MKNENGMTLLELLLAIAILSIVITPFYTQFVQSVELGERSERIVRAEYIAQKKVLEEEKKRSPQIPNTGNKRETTIDTFKVVLTYIDQSDEINDSDNNLEYFVDSSSFDYQIVPNVSNGKVSFNFYTNNGTFLSKTLRLRMLSLLN